MDPKILQIGFSIVSLLGVLGATWVGLLIKNALYNMREHQNKLKEDIIARQTQIKDDQLGMKADLIASQVTVQTELLNKYAVQHTELAVHIAKDEGQFMALTKTLDRIEIKVDRLAGDISSK